MSHTTDKVIDEMNNIKDKCEHEYVMKTSLKHGRTICQCVFCSEYYEVD